MTPNRNTPDRTTTTICNNWAIVDLIKKSFFIWLAVSQLLPFLMKGIETVLLQEKIDFSAFSALSFWSYIDMNHNNRVFLLYIEYFLKCYIPTNLIDFLTLYLNSLVNQFSFLCRTPTLGFMLFAKKGFLVVSKVS